jgi:hypothetical protein
MEYTKGDRWQMILLAKSKCELQIMIHQLDVNGNKYKTESSATKTKPIEMCSNNVQSYIYT